MASGADESSGLGAVIRSGEALLVHEITEEMLARRAQDPEHLGILREVGLNSAMIAPIRSGERILGALSFISCTSRRFDARDLQLACDLGRQTGVIIDSAELQAAQSHIAQTLQAGLIPRSLPVVEGWELSSAYRAAGRAVEVGGDFYDLLSFEGGWAAVIGDVVGKGAEAAALTALARHTLAAIVEATGDLAYALRVLNRRLRQRSDDYRSLCTVAAVLVTPDEQVTILSAGHPLPLLRRDGAAWPVGRPSPMLGFVDDVELLSTPVAVKPGDQLILYTDGVLDAIGPDERFGEARLLETVRAAGRWRRRDRRAHPGGDRRLSRLRSGRRHRDPEPHAGAGCGGAPGRLTWPETTAGASGQVAKIYADASPPTEQGTAPADTRAPADPAPRRRGWRCSAWWPPPRWRRVGGTRGGMAVRAGVAGLRRGPGSCARPGSSVSATPCAATPCRIP